MSRNYSSTAVDTTLSSGINAGATSVVVVSTTGFPAPPFILALDAGAASQELVLVTAVGGTTLTVERGYDSTVATTHDAGAVVRHSHAAIDFREAGEGLLATAGTPAASGVAARGVAVKAARSDHVHPEEFDFTAVSTLLAAATVSGDALDVDTRLRLQGGTVVGVTDASGDLTITFPVAFDTGLLAVIPVLGDPVNVPDAEYVQPHTSTETSTKVRVFQTSGAVLASTNVRVNYLAVGW